ncbi:MAG TPA: hypothetical protein VEC13_02230 [Candidatus Paceibacterota bacterium]|nr:hypothetical protein [Candidatus Paceibacterota bacterium]
MNNKRYFLIYVFLFTLLAPSSFVFAQLSEKAIGGEITDVRPCECTATWLLTIDDYATGEELKLVYQPGFSKIYLYYNYMTATYLVGSYNSSRKNMCRALNKNGNCKAVPTDGTLGNQPGTGFSL